MSDTQTNQQNPIISAAKRFKMLKEKLDTLKAETTEVQKEYDRLRFNELPDLMVDSGLETPLRVADVGTISLTDDIRAAVVPENKDDALTWLDDHGYGDLVKPNIAPASLKSLIKDRIEKGEATPQELFKVDVFTRASLRKK